MSAKKNKTDNSLAKAINTARSLTENYRGVKLDVVKLRNNKEKIFRATIQYNNVKHSLGYYENVIDAAMAYNKKAKNLFGSAKKAQAAGRWNVVQD
jgi:hypothetical protein